jgi:hypothetical protein
VTAGHGPRRSTATAPTPGPRIPRSSSASRSALVSDEGSRSISCSTARENRSQLVFTRIQGGREGIFWQTARTTRQARPGIRVPRRLAAGLAELTILIDSRERYPYKFTQQQATTERQALPVGDYAVAHDGEIVAAVERKSLADLVHRLIDGQLTYALADMATIPRAAVVVEDRYSSLFKLEHTQPGFVTEILAAVTVRYPTVPIHFAETRPLAEEWTYRVLGAALAYRQTEALTGERSF